MSLLKIKVDNSALLNDIQVALEELNSTRGLPDNQRRDAIERVIEKLRTLKARASHVEVV